MMRLHIIITTLARYAAKNNRELIVWEGFAPQQGQTGRSSHPASTVSIPTSGIVVTPFDCFYYPPPQLAADGYKILNSAWTPLYVLSAYHFPIFFWLL